MQLMINGEKRDFDNAAALADVIENLDVSTDGVAVALNDEVVPQSRWNNTKVNSGDRIEIIHAVQGG
jgi:sulfur carrier protein